MIPIICKLAAGCGEVLSEIDAECNIPAWSGKLFEGELDSNTSLVYGARAGGKIVGFIVLHVVGDEAHIVTFGVRSSCRRLGIGRELLTHCISELQELSVAMIFLEVRRSNLAAQALYHFCGFTQVGVRESYYSNNQEDAIVLRLKMEDYAEIFGQSRAMLGQVGG